MEPGSSPRRCPGGNCSAMSLSPGEECESARVSFKALEADGPKECRERRGKARQCSHLTDFSKMGAGRHFKTTKRIVRILRNRQDKD